MVYTRDEIKIKKDIMIMMDKNLVFPNLFVI